MKNLFGLKMYFKGQKGKKITGSLYLRHALDSNFLSGYLIWFPHHMIPHMMWKAAS